MVESYRPGFAFPITILFGEHGKLFDKRNILS